MQLFANIFIITSEVQKFLRKLKIYAYKLLQNINIFTEVLY